MPEEEAKCQAVTRNMRGADLKKPRPVRSSRGLSITDNVISTGDVKSPNEHSGNRYNNTTAPGCSISEVLLTPEELLFYVYFVMMLLVKGLGFSDGPVYKAGFLAGSVLALGKILLSSYTRAEAVMVYLLLALAGISFLHSRDYSVEYMKSMKDTLASRFGRCVYTDTGERRGAAAARNACLRCASGEYVFFIDADDSLLSDIFLSELYNPCGRENPRLQP